jgi:starch synthase
VFVDCWYLFHRPGSPYADPAGVPFHDNALRFAVLNMAACEAPLVLNVGGLRCAPRGGVRRGCEEGA